MVPGCNLSSSESTSHAPDYSPLCPKALCRMALNCWLPDRATKAHRAQLQQERVQPESTETPKVSVLAWPDGVVCLSHKILWEAWLYPSVVAVHFSYWKLYWRGVRPFHSQWLWKKNPITRKMQTQQQQNKETNKNPSENTTVMVEGETVPSCSLDILHSWKCWRRPEALAYLQTMFILTLVLLLARGPTAMPGSPPTKWYKLDSIIEVMTSKYHPFT